MQSLGAKTEPSHREAQNERTNRSCCTKDPSTSAEDGRISVEYVDIDLLQPNPANPRVMPKEEMHALEHSVEVAYLASMIASELGANVNIAKKVGLLHDIGKAVDREVEGTHAAIGADLVKQWEKSPEVLKGVAEHHLETSDTSFWGYIASTADAISSARPGARRDGLDSYLRRLKALEDIADSFKGVEKSYAIQAGREVRILVKPEAIDDLGARRLARDIVKKVEETLEYPGQIKVTVIRETRAVDYAK